MRKGLLVVVSGPSGAGKGTVCKELIKSINIQLSISATTRKPRKGEVNGINYFFTPKEDFIQKINDDRFLEYAKVYNNYYGTYKEYVLDEINKGKDVLLEIDIQGALKVKEKYPEGVFIFLLPPSMKELRNRIVGRGSETQESLEMRYNSALKEISYVDKYNYYVVNDKVETAVDRIRTIIEAEHCRVNNDIDKLIQKYKEEIKCYIHQ